MLLFTAPAEGPDGGVALFAWRWSLETSAPDDEPLLLLPRVGDVLDVAVAVDAPLDADGAEPGGAGAQEVRVAVLAAEPDPNGQPDGQPDGQPAGTLLLTTLRLSGERVIADAPVRLAPERAYREPRVFLAPEGRDAYVLARDERDDYLVLTSSGGGGALRLAGYAADLDAVLAFSASGRVSLVRVHPDEGLLVVGLEEGD